MRRRRSSLLLLLCGGWFGGGGSGGGSGGGGGGVACAQETMQVTDLLARLDKDEDGYVTRAEFKAMLRAEHHHRYRRAYEAAVEHLHEYYDHGDGGAAHVLEKHDDALHGDHHVPLPEGMPAGVDANGDGRLSVHEMRAHLMLPESVEHMMDMDVDKLLAAADLNGDGALDYEEAFADHAPLMHIASHDARRYDVADEL